MTEIELEFNKEARRIYEAMEDRIIELIERVEKKNTTKAYFIAFQIGCICDIEGELKKILKEARESLKGERNEKERRI